jgi:hypothetical protein
MNEQPPTRAELDLERSKRLAAETDAHGLREQLKRISREAHSGIAEGPGYHCYVQLERIAGLAVSEPEGVGS